MKTTESNGEFRLGDECVGVHDIQVGTWIHFQYKTFVSMKQGSRIYRRLKLIGDWESLWSSLIAAVYNNNNNC